ncbi:MAG: PLP-dependent transferase, partial [Actinomycetota bacterium]|nr:PLP-dependent transferase [Actinomycetota bacterium]
MSASSGSQRNGDHGESTRAVHLPLPPPVTQRSMGLPVWRTAAFAFADAQEYVDVLGGQRDGYSYSRLANPTADAFAAAVAALEGVGLDEEVRGEAFGSGMAAITAILMGFTAAGAHVVASREMYGGTYGVLADLLARFGVRTDHVDTTDPAAVSAAIRPETTLVWAETLANPTMTVADLPSLAGIAHRAG